MTGSSEMVALCVMSAPLGDNIVEYTVTVAEAAAMFNVSAATIRRWENDGLIRGRRTLGGQRRFKRAELEALR